MRQARLATLALLCPAILACGRERLPVIGQKAGTTVTVPDPGTGVPVAVDVATCTRCHGDENRALPAADPLVAAAPPRTVKGETDPGVRGVGAHLAHLAGGELSRAVACGSCHVVPTGAGNHAPPAGKVTFRGLAVARGAAPTWDAAAASCSATYCHGNFLDGNGGNRPTWTGGPAQATCGSCHAIPPGGAHPAIGAAPLACDGCHAGYTPTSVDPGRHVNGRVDLSGSCDACHGDPPPPAPPGTSPQSYHPQSDRCSLCHPGYSDQGSPSRETGSTHMDGKVDHVALACTTCHGDPARSGSDAGGQALAPAPPSDSTGAAASDAVGAHQAHLASPSFSARVACGECHAGRIPVPGGELHAGGTADVAFGALAAAVLPGDARTVAPAWDAAGLTCSATYCHGDFRNGSAANQPSWSGGAAQAACGSCHGLPPGGTHPSGAACASCHPGFAAGLPDPLLHVDGNVDLSLGCTSCHGDPARARGAGQDAAVAAAPPLGAAGETSTSTRAVGAHLPHLQKTTFRAAPLACADCHVVPASVGHANGAAELSFGALARTGGTAPSFDGTSCSATYCHGGFGYGAAASPAWTGTFAAGGTNLGCASCHGMPPPVDAAGRHHPQNASCGDCHPGSTASAVDKATHGDGLANRPRTGCTQCHGDLAVTAVAPGDPAAAPGFAAGSKDARGNPDTATDRRGVGAHRIHLAGGALANPIACAECHAALPAAGDVSHADGNAAFGVAFGPLASTAWPGKPAISPRWDGAAGPATTCSSVYCHGSFGGGLAGRPDWTAAGSVSCGSCHGLPPALLTDGLTAHPPRADCAACHGAGYDPAAGTVSKAAHLNGRVDGGGHAAGWRDPGQHGLAALSFAGGNAGLESCTACHVGFGPAGAASSSCDLCHANPAAQGMAGYPAHADWRTECTFCHGGRDDGSGAPPRNTRVVASDLTTPQPTTDPTIGAHTSHVGARHAIAAALACTDCHPAVADVSTPGHVDGTPADVSFGPRPGTYAGGSCSATTCHGNFTGGASAAPPWTGTFGAAFTLDCTSCHASPPPLTAATHHPQNTSCAACHGAGYARTGATTGTVAAATHVDGAVTRSRTGCTLCHGNLSKTGQTLAQAAAAAPGYDPGSVDTQGNTATTAAGVGAHAAHLVAGRLRPPLACAECHALPPADADLGHATGPRATLSFGPLASTGGATPTYDPATGRCSSAYCHGSTLAAGGTNQAPRWTGGGAEAACGTCHGAPPPAATGHPENADCDACHTGYSLAQGTVDLARHLNGAFDPPPSGCNVCHGDATGTRTSFATSAPPADSRGGTAVSARGVGAHAAHLRTDGRSRDVTCSACHDGPGGVGHNDGVARVALAGLSVQGVASPATVTWNGAGGAATVTCSNTYCHGNFTGGKGANVTPDWTATAGLPLGCTACHGNPPALPHPQDATCSDCHGAGYARTGADTGAVVRATHVDGQVALVAGRAGCTACHGDGARAAVAGADAAAAAAPPLGTRGETATTSRAVGAHLRHVNDRSKPVACAECHAAVPAGADRTHADGATPIAFGALSRTGGAAPSYGAAAATCAATYCHGSFARYGLAAAASWADAATGACGTCHGVPPAKATGHVQNAACAACHGAGYSATTVSASLHVNGVSNLSVAPACTTCHGAAGRASVDPANADADQAAAPPTDTTGASGTLAAGAHLAHVNPTPAQALARPLKCDVCHSPKPTAAAHADGSTNVTFAGAAVAGGSTPAYLAPTCSATWCHGNFAGGTRAAPSWGSAGPLGCDACHGNPPSALTGDPGHPRNDVCSGCHPGYAKTGPASGTVNLSTHVNGAVDHQPLGCTSCHGDAARVAAATAPDAALVKAAPPSDTRGATGVASAGVGAHLAHANGARSKAVACAECHGGAVPVAPDHLHADGSTTVAFGTLARTGGVAPSYAGAGGSCSASYCHGNFTGGSGAGATAAWTSAAGALGCASCHGAPPPIATRHPPSTACGSCHAGYGPAAVVAATHVDGSLTLDAARAGCVACHGDPARTSDPTWTAGLVDANVKASPPVAANSSSANAVGGHLAHVNRARASAIRNPLACAECHAVPAAGDRTHANGTAAVSFGALARTGTTPTYAAASGTCSATYCHGATLAGGTATSPTWNGPAPSCASCHGNPPPQSSGHPQNTGCATCHGAGYASTGPTGGTITGAALATHLDGAVTLAAAEGCTSCHGTSGRAGVAGADAGVSAAPPVDTTGGSASLGVGAHLAHANQARPAPMSRPFSCATCHDPVPATNAHGNGTTEVAFSGVALAGGIAPAAATYVSPGCNGTYCHGNFAGGNGIGPSPAWNATSAQLGCTSCHGLPPPIAANHPQGTACSDCHGAGYSTTAVVAATHVDGAVALSAGRSGCTACHGDAARSLVAGADPNARAAPPIGTRNETATTARAVGAHLSHLNLAASTLRQTPIACGECHAVPAAGDRAHAGGTAAVAFGPLARTAWAGQPPIAPAYDAALNTCASTYCHGSFRNGAAATVQWKGTYGATTTLGCNGCHGRGSGATATPPVAPHPNNAACGGCHAGYSAVAANLALHLNGALDVAALTCASCHGDGARAPVASATALDALGANLVKSSPPLDASGASGSGVGAHLAHLNQGAAAPALSSALACASCHAVPATTAHADNAVQLTFAGLAVAGGAAPSFAAGTHTCSSTYCHGSFPGGNGANPVVWTAAGKLACTACHGSPPGPVSAAVHHPQNPTCGACHADYAASLVVAATHVDGTVQKPPAGCTQCHGDLTAAGVASTDVRAAPASNA
ncbi:MAG TPA: CxxxxCH/CxxCH domain-containing protein, partial [Anaeromyxobacteraceae bacterium]